MEKTNNKKRIILIIANVFLIFMLLLTFFSNTIISYSLPQVVTIKASSGKINNSEEFIGVAEQRSTTTIRADAEKTIKSIDISVGDKVTKGDTLFSFYSSSDILYNEAVSQLEELKNQYTIQLLENTSSDYDIAKYNIQNAKNDLTTAQNTYSTMLETEKELLIKKGELEHAETALSEFENKHSINNEDSDEMSFDINEYENLKTAKNNAQIAYDSLSEKLIMTSEEARLDVVEKERSLRLLELELEEQIDADDKNKKISDLNLKSLKSSITAQELKVKEEYNKLHNNSIKSSVDGTVVSINVEAETEIATGDALAVIAFDNGEYKISLDVPSIVTTKLDNEDSLKFKSKTNLEGMAKVESIIKNEEMSDTKIVTLSFNTDENIAGEEISVFVGDEEETADVVVPNSVINEDSGGKFVYVINAEYGSFGNKYFAKKTSVKVGKSDSSNSIIEEGINKNDYIVVTSNKNLEEGQRVKIANEDDYN